MKEGQTIAGKYRLHHLLGTGGMATVWSATNVFTDRQFAIKFLLPNVAKTPEASRRFLMEAKVSGRVQHPNIIEVMDVGQAEDGVLFLVMELLQGVSLEMAMRQQSPPMSLYEFAGVMTDVARALAAAHRGGVIHRDLKPSNIFMHKDRGGIAVPKVLDFGVSKFLLDDDRNNALTVAGTVLGSPLYMSPEQAVGASDIDHRTDVFAFGAILFEGLCGFRAYDAPNFNALIVTIATQQPKSIDQYGAHLPESLRAIVRDCMVTDRKKRIAGFDQVVERMTALLPELEHNPLRLPAPIQRDSRPPPDPESTSAMPAIVRPSDRPPSFHEGPPPVSASQAPWAGSLPGVRPKRTPVLLFAAVGMLLASILIVGVLVLAVARRHFRSVAAAASTPAAASVVAQADPAPTTSASADVPVINIDSLPVASASASKHTVVPRGRGRLYVDASPHWCTVSVDGKVRGPTPLANLSVSAGPHTLRCETSGGVAKTVTITVYGGQTVRHKFATSP